MHQLPRIPNIDGLNLTFTTELVATVGTTAKSGMPPGSEKPFKCSKTIAVVEGGEVHYRPCQARFASFRSMCRHRRIARVHWPNTCGICLRAVSDESMEAHRKACLESARRCPLCSFTGSGAEIEQHVCDAHASLVANLHTVRRRSDHREPVRMHPKRFRCRVCGAAFVSQWNLTRHAAGKCVFPSGTQKECVRCGQVFTIRRYYTHHMRTHCNEDRPPEVELQEPPESSGGGMDLAFVCPPAVGRGSSL